MAMLTRSAAPGSPKALQRFHKCIAFLWPSLQTTSSNNSRQAQSTHVDAIDCFTNELVSRKTKKWVDMRDNLRMQTESGIEGEEIAVISASAVANKQSNNKSSGTSFAQGVGLMAKSVISDLQAVRAPELGLDIRTLSQAQLDQLLQSTLEIKNKVDFLYLIKQCIAWRQLPCNEVLIACLKYLSSLSKVQQIDSLADICRAQQHPLMQSHAALAPFRAMALWRSGNADSALLTLSRGYADSTGSEEGRRMIRAAFRTIAEETLSQKSEAVLVVLLDVARHVHREHKDIFVLACVWKQSFLSAWFCDQKSAALLFEEFKELQALVARRSSSLCASFLRQDNVDAVHRLIEAFLQYKQRDACANCLDLLFNYQYYRSDLRACAEIIKSCSELEMPLSETQNEKFLSLFLNQTEPSMPLPAMRDTQQFQYKF